MFLLLAVTLLQMTPCAPARRVQGVSSELLASHQVTSQGETFIPLAIIVTGVKQETANRSGKIK